MNERLLGVRRLKSYILSNKFWIMAFVILNLEDLAITRIAVSHGFHEANPILVNETAAMVVKIIGAFTIWVLPGFFRPTVSGKTIRVTVVCLAIVVLYNIGFSTFTEPSGGSGSFNPAYFFGMLLGIWALANIVLAINDKLTSMRWRLR